MYTFSFKYNHLGISRYVKSNIFKINFPPSKLLYSLFPINKFSKLETSSLLSIHASFVLSVYNQTLACWLYIQLHIPTTSILYLNYLNSLLMGLHAHGQSPYSQSYFSMSIWPLKLSLKLILTQSSPIQPLDNLHSDTITSSILAPHHKDSTIFIMCRS